MKIFRWVGCVVDDTRAKAAELECMRLNWFFPHRLILISRVYGARSSDADAQSCPASAPYCHSAAACVASIRASS